MATHFMTWAVMRLLGKLLFWATAPVLLFGLLLAVLAAMGSFPSVVAAQVTTFTAAFMIFDATLWLMGYAETRA